MTQRERVIVGKADFDKTLSEPRHGGIWRKIEGSWAMKFPNRPIDGATAGIQLLRDQEDIVFGGIATGRRKILRPWTAHQAKKIGVEKEEITYTANSKDFAPKIVDVLKIASEQEFRDVSAQVTAFFIDDNINGMRRSAARLAQDPHYKDLMERYNFTFIAFNPKPEDNLENLTTDDGRTVMRVIKMENWQPEIVERVLQELR